MIIPVILAGGMGTRLWPLSRKDYPKQFLALGDSDKTLLQQTLERAQVISPHKPLVICHEDHRFLAAEQCRAVGIDVDLLLEPTSNNTTQAIGLAAHYLKQKGLSQALMLVLPADHFMQNVEPVRIAVADLSDEVKKGKVGIFGILPTYAATTYGYLQVQPQDHVLLSVVRFHEKPEIERAQFYIDQNHNSAKWLWNSGIFFWQVEAFLNALATHQGSSFQQLKQAIKNASGDLDFIRPDAQYLTHIIAQPIDIALLERLATDINTEVVAVALHDTDWSDLGSWQALHAINPKDEFNNAVVGSVYLDNTNNSYVHNASTRQVVLLGMENCTVVDTPDVLMVANNTTLNGVAKMASSYLHPEPKLMHRPWGSYEVLHQHTGFKVKHLSVKPGGQLSLQKHGQRSEHWVVVKGIATVIRMHNGQELIQTLHENESTFIPCGDIHSLANYGGEVLEIVEVQSGGYLGEDDIIRLKDSYGRIQ